MTTTIRFKRIGPVEVPAPKFAHPGDAGVDLYAATLDPWWLRPGDRVMIPTGLSLEIHPGFEGQIRPRSGLAAEFGIGVVNSPGTIDSGFRGHVKVVLINHGQDAVVVRPLDRIAQLVIHKLPDVAYELAEDLTDTDRGAGGFGSTGMAP